MPDGRAQDAETADGTGLTRFGCGVERLDAGWALACCPPDTARHPRELPAGLAWHAAAVPGHAGQTLAGADLDACDVWYRGAVPPGPAGRRIRFNGLATLAEAWIGDRPLLRSESMFVAREAALPDGAESGAPLWLRFRALVAPPDLPRARWRTGFVRHAFLRGIRSTLAGRLEGAARGPIVGPWRPIEVLTPLPGLPRFGAPRIAVELDADGTGHLGLRLPLLDAEADTRCTLHIATHDMPLHRDGPALRGAISLPGVAPWWPHSHGEPALHDLALSFGNTLRTPLGRVGFRRIELDRGADRRGFALRINGVPVFCRGAAWASPDTAAPLVLLTRARDAGLNMIRLPGTGCYADAAFHDACDTLGLLVWQDFMFARLDYPAADPRFRAAVGAEARQLLDSLQGRPSLAVLCGGSEVAQQAAMLGLPEDAWSSPLFDEQLPALCAALRPDAPYVPNAPCGPPGELPFRLDSGIAHDFGVGGYLRPLSHARDAGTRFAAACLAFSHIPDADALRRLGHLPGTPGWKAGIPRDAGAAWDFEDVRDHYLRDLYRVDPALLRREDPERWLALSRAATAEAVEACFAAWRRPDSGCGGALLIALQDGAAGAGWGVLDEAGRPKPAWYALRRAARPVQLLLLDEGLNGVALHLLNETSEPIAATLAIECWRGATSVARGRRPVLMPARGTLSFAGEALFGGFFDAMGHWRFGPLDHEAVFARLDADGADEDAPPLAWATLFPRGRGLPPRDPGLTALLLPDDSLRLATSAFAETVTIEDEAGFLPTENGFHLPPGRPWRIALRPGRAARSRPYGRITALNGLAGIRYGDDR